MNKLIFLSVLISLTTACSSEKIVRVDELSLHREKLLDHTLLLIGAIREVKGILSICSNPEKEMCVPIEAEKSVHENLKRVEGSTVKLYGKYLDHDFIGDDFLPSRFHVLKIVQ